MSEQEKEKIGRVLELSEGNIRIDLPDVRRKIAEQVKAEIDLHVQTTKAEPFRWHLGASKIGDPCARALWYHYRWTQPHLPSGRMMRLLDRGDLEEIRNATWLRAIGFELWTHDESITKPDGTHPQFRIKNRCGGHLGGSLDGIGKFPKHYGIDLPFVLEGKTSGTGRGFTDLTKDGVFKAKPAHFTQNSIYGYDYGIPLGLYISTNKNDDDMHIEYVKLDFKHAEDMIARADSIILSQTPPAKISENPTFTQCKSLCEFKDICHFSKPAAKNCRSCANCNPVEGGEFYCSVEQSVIPRQYVKDGCGNWKSITQDSAKVIPIEPIKEKLEKPPEKTTGFDDDLNSEFEIEDSIPIPK